MGILRNFARLRRFVFGLRPLRIDDPHCAAKELRACRFETLEDRKVLAADIHLGAVFLEGDLGNDDEPDIIQVTFEGGAPGTQLTRVVIDGDKDGDGKYSAGEIFFDTAAGGIGEFGHAPLKIVSSQGFTVLNFQVVDGGQKIVFDLDGFDAGEKLVFSVDVDEVQFVDPDNGEIDANAIVEGAEFQRSILTGSFKAPHYFDIQGSGKFFDFYDQNFANAATKAGSTLDLPPDSYIPPSTENSANRTAGAVLTLTQVPLPITIAGTVFHDRSLNNLREAGEEGIGGVQLTLLSWNGSQWVSTGKTTTTNSQGQYKFDGLLPGSYRIAETQPTGWLSVGSKPGTVDGVVNGVTVNPDTLSQIVMLGGEDGINYDFGEALPGIISGRVHADPEGDCIIGPNDILLSGVVIELLDAGGNVIRTTTTNNDGYYEFTGLVPGKYGVREKQPNGFFHGDQHVGSAGGVVAGDDLITQIIVGSGVVGVDYDFCELMPNSISGYVHADPEGDCEIGPNDIPLEGVRIDLLDAHGNVVKTTFTDQNGFYKFDNLAPGTYGVREHQPAGYFDHDEHVGSLGGVISGNDWITQIVVLSDDHGVHYDFCELLPNSISGYVHADPEADAKIGPNDIPLAGVRIDLLDASGKVIKTVLTDSDGFYKFDNLAPGTYGVREHQPAGYFDFEEVVGSLGGIISANDLMTQIVVLSADHGVHYDFFELLPSSISGRVHADPEGDCEIGPNDIPLAGVRIDLLDAGGKVIKTTLTDQNGFYKFDNLAPGTYGVREHQPAGYFDHDEHVGSLGGVISGNDLITQIVVLSDDHGVHYDFCELLPNSISGYIHVDPEADAKIGPKDIPLANVRIDLLDASGKVIKTVLTDSNGFYKFDNLAPGTYGVREHQPSDYFDFDEVVGSLGGIISANDKITQIVVLSDDHGVHYDFFELLPGSISGRVHADPEGDCVFGPNDIPLSGVTIELLDANGKVIATTKTNSKGIYKFKGLAPNQVYAVREIQPIGYFQGGTKVGSAGGVVAAQDFITQILIGAGIDAVDYNFCEKMPNSIAGRVFVDPEGDCIFGPNDQPLANVTIQLLDADGKVIATTKTNANGRYKFDDLAPGTYGVREIQPKGYFQGGEIVGSLGGVISAKDLITQIVVLSDDHGVRYDFCEVPGGKISGYVFQDGPPIEEIPDQPRPNPEEVRDGKRTADDTPIAGVRLLLYDASGNPILDSKGKQRATVTDSKGYYEFANLPVGSYLVRQIQPEDYVDSLDTPGTTGGVAINRRLSPAEVPLLPFSHNFDVIANISLGIGGNSRENNFSEVVYVTPTIIPPIPLQVLPIPPAFLPTGVPQPFPELNVPPPRFIPPFPYLDGSDGLGYTWHLSIVDAGYPRGPVPQAVAMNFVSINAVAWSKMNVTRGEWILQNADGQIVRRETIGMKDATAVAGDFNGDGVMELGLFVDGEWFIDLNGNGKWDAGDLWAKLGSRDDKPVVGDWDGDGKDDIGIYGPAWPRDPIAVHADPGLPDPLNAITGKKKNPPPEEDEAALGRRKMQRGASGQMREDLIDHVFHYGAAVDRPVVGDWTGNGLRRIGIFYNGTWNLDIDGDGRFGPRDLKTKFGAKGDIPVVGDWNGEGIERIGVFRGGTWILDTNGNNMLDGQDKVVHLGQPGDQPVVGDWNGDGRDEVGVYHSVPGNGDAGDAVADVAAEDVGETVVE